MAKINVILRGQMDSGKEVKMPGEVVAMEEAQASSLASMGMVELPGERPDAKPAKRSRRHGALAALDSAEPDDEAASAGGAAENGSEGA